jgi:hypothetical protein
MTLELLVITRNDGIEGLHLRFRDSFRLPRPISMSLDRHQDRLCPAGRSFS